MGNNYEIVGIRDLFSYSDNEMCVKHGNYYLYVKYRHIYNSSVIDINYIDKTYYRIFKNKEENFVFNQDTILEHEVKIYQEVINSVKNFIRKDKLEKLSI